MNPELVPSAIVTQLLEAAAVQERWADTHRTASLAEHEQGVLGIFRRTLGPVLGAVLERALRLDQPASGRQRAACLECGRRRRPHQWRTRRPLSVCGPTPFRRPYFWCGPCGRGWVPADSALGLEPRQRLSSEPRRLQGRAGANIRSTLASSAVNGRLASHARSARRWATLARSRWRAQSRTRAAASITP